MLLEPQQSQNVLVPFLDDEREQASWQAGMSSNSLPLMKPAGMVGVGEALLPTVVKLEA